MYMSIFVATSNFQQNLSQHVKMYLKIINLEKVRITETEGFDIYKNVWS